MFINININISINIRFTEKALVNGNEIALAILALSVTLIEACVIVAKFIRFSE